MISTTSDHSAYQPKLTSHISNHPRYNILPLFPEITTETIRVTRPTLQLLLANVPMLHLSFEQRSLRERTYEDWICYIQMSQDLITTRETHILYTLFVTLSQQWRLSKAILIFNYERMLASMVHLALEDFIVLVPHISWSIEEWQTALEIYLQMDVDCFYMKTCSYHGSQRRTFDYITHVESEGIFCLDPIEARYSMKPCHQPTCSICQHIDRQSSVNFTDYQNHTLVNGYQVILNCNVNCSSTKVIYCLTCPCGHYDYIGKTMGQFSDQLQMHREHAARIIREFLLGEAIVQQMNSNSKTDDMRLNDRLDLYRHLVHCPQAMMVFLNYYVAFWCLVPMPIAQADIDDIQMNENQSSFLYDYFHRSKLQVQSTTVVFDRTDDAIFWCLDHLPIPPPSYRFSKRQRQDQYYFFKAKLDQRPLSAYLDLYRSTIIFAAPEKTSLSLLHFIQALFVTHGECKLNTKIPHYPSAFVRGIDWCQSLKRPSYS